MSARLPTVLLTALCAVCASVAGAAEGEVLTYRSPEVGCNWLEIEYETVKVHAPGSDALPPAAVTREGVMMFVGMLLSAPMIVFDEIFGEERPRYDFSRDPDDIAAAAEAKQCKALLELMALDKDGGNYPPPLKNDTR